MLLFLKGEVSIIAKLPYCFHRAGGLMGDFSTAEKRWRGNKARVVVSEGIQTAPPHQTNWESSICKKKTPSDNKTSEERKKKKKKRKNNPAATTVGML
jgi:hypothetical protein